MQWTNCSLTCSTAFKGTRSTRVPSFMAHQPSLNILPCLRTLLRDLSKMNWLPSLWWKKVTNLETLVWFQQGEMNSANMWMDHLEEYHQELWRGAQDWLDVHQKELGSIQVEHERFQAKMKETVRVLERNSELMLAALEQCLIESIGKLMTMSRTCWCQYSCQALQFQSSAWNSVADNRLLSKSLSSTSGGKLGRMPGSMQLGTSAPRWPWTSVPTVTACLSHSPRLRKPSRYKDQRAQAPFSWPWIQSLQPRPDQPLPTLSATGSLPGC